jgi:hypothetical protein
MWSAIYAGGKLIRFDPDGAIDRVIELPVSHPTCCCFGGEALDALFVTSAIEPLGPQERTTEPLAGKVLAFKPGVRGRAEFKTRLCNNAQSIDDTGPNFLNAGATRTGSRRARHENFDSNGFDQW